MTCIKDINPASTHHYLILPNKHINNAKELCSTDAELCKFKCNNLIGILNLIFVYQNRSSTVIIFR